MSLRFFVFAAALATSVSVSNAAFCAEPGCSTPPGYINGQFELDLTLSTPDSYWKDRHDRAGELAAAMSKGNAAAHYELTPVWEERWLANNHYDDDVVGECIPHPQHFFRANTEVFLTTIVFPKGLPKDGLTQYFSVVRDNTFQLMDAPKEPLEKCLSSVLCNSMAPLFSSAKDNNFELSGRCLRKASDTNCASPIMSLEFRRKP